MRRSTDEGSRRRSSRVRAMRGVPKMVDEHSQERRGVRRSALGRDSEWRRMRPHATESGAGSAQDGGRALPGSGGECVGALSPETRSGGGCVPAQLRAARGVPKMVDEHSQGAAGSA